MYKRATSLSLSLLLACAGLTSAQNFVLQASVIASGAVSGASTNYKIQGTVGQAAIGSGTSTNFKGAWGFWHGFASLSSAGVFADLRVFLQGPYGSGSMDASLGSDIPLSQPYSGAPWSYSGSESVASGFFGSHPTVVDWVFVQVREETPGPGSPPMTVAAERAGFVLTDGSIVDLDGVSPLSFSTLPAGTYYVVVDHRNHLRAMSASGIASVNDTLDYDFTTAGTQGYSGGGPAMKALGDGNYGLFAGDANQDGDILANDFTAWFSATKLGSTGYLDEDFNMDTDALTDDFVIWFANTLVGAQAQVPNP